MLKNKKTRVAVIGLGNMGRNHLRNYSQLKNVELVGLADINPSTKQLASEYKTEYFKDYKTMLDKAKPDAVSIVLPTPFHYPVAHETMSSGIHTLLEKPISMNVKEADKLIALAKKQKVIFTVGHLEHYNPVIRKIKQLVDNKAIGKITSVVCIRVGGFPSIEPKTDVIIDLAVHDIDIISFLLGEKAKKISSHGSRTHHSQKIDSAEILIDFGRASGFVQVNWLTPVKVRTISLTGSDGYLSANYITQELKYYKHNMKRIKDGFSNFVVEMGKPEKKVIKVKFEEPLAVELQSFIARIRGDASVHLVEPSAARDALSLALEAVKPYDVIK